MASELTKAVYKLLTPDKPVTATGAAHLLRDLELTPAYSELVDSLDWLVRNGYATRNPDTGFQP